MKRKREIEMTLRLKNSQRKNRSRIPEEFAFELNDPNPVSRTTTITCAIPRKEYVRLKVYNALGQLVATLIHGIQDAGRKSVEFALGDLPDGVYIYRLRAGTFADTRAMLHLR